MEAYQALYRKYRPQTFDDVIGQNAVTQTLKSQIISGKISHAYLFTGCRGTGKTSCAKILAKAVNCLKPENGNPCNRCAICNAIDDGTCLDVLEIDAASNTGVDNIRDLRDTAVYTPTQAKKRVYIVDEVHMLSQGAFNALLKTIEEPPEHLIFILATTELQKVPATILSRCQRFTFRRISQDDITSRLQFVAYQENIDMDSSTAFALARAADGALRDALSLLDQCASAVTGELTLQKVYSCLGIAGERKCAELLGRIADRDSAGALALFNELYTGGKDLAAMLNELSNLIRDILILKTAPGPGVAMLSGVADDNEVKELAGKLSGGELMRMMELLQKTMNLFTRGNSRRTDAELCLLEMSQPELSRDISAMNARITRIEEQLKSGSFLAAMPNQQQSQGNLKIPVDSNLQIEDSKKEEAQPKISERKKSPASEELPMGFWQELASAVRKELSPPISGFFSSASDGPINVALSGDTIVLLCGNSFTAEIIDKPTVLEIVSRKATFLLGKPVRAIIEDASKREKDGSGMEKLLQFGRNNPDIVTIK